MEKGNDELTKFQNFDFIYSIWINNDNYLLMKVFLGFCLQSGWRPEFAKNPFSRPGLTGSSRDVYASSPAIDVTGPARPVSIPNRDMYSSDIAGPPHQRQLPATNFVQPPQTPAAIPPPQQLANFPPLSQQSLPLAMLPPFSLPQTSAVLPEKLLPSSSVLQSTTPEIVINMNNFPAGVIPLPTRVETLSNHKPGSFVLNAAERGQIPLPVNAPERRPNSFPEPPRPLHHTIPIGNLGPVPDSWRGRQGFASNPLNQNNYNSPARGTVLTAPPRERNEYAFEGEFETWSPEGSPSRTPDYNMIMLGGHNPLEPRMSSGRNHPPPDRLRYQHRTSSGYRDYNIIKHGNNGNRRWRDRDRDRRR